MIAQEVDLVEIFFLLLRANLPDVPKKHSQIFINPMTTNGVFYHDGVIFFIFFYQNGVRLKKITSGTTSYAQIVPI